MEWPRCKVDWPLNGIRGPILRVGRVLRDPSSNGATCEGEIVGFRGPTVLSMPLSQPESVAPGARLAARAPNFARRPFLPHRQPGVLSARRGSGTLRPTAHRGPNDHRGLHRGLSRDRQLSLAAACPPNLPLVSGPERRGHGLVRQDDGWLLRRPFAGGAELQPRGRIGPGLSPIAGRVAPAGAAARRRWPRLVGRFAKEPGDDRPP